MIAHRQQLSDELQNCSQRAKSLFALLCAERLRGCCWAYQESCSLNLEVFFQWNEALFEILLKDKQLDIATLRQGQQDVEAIMPSGGEPLEVQAQSGVLCLLIAMELLVDENLSAVDAANYIIDAVDNYDFFIRRRLTGETSSPSTHLLLEREISRQNADVSFVKMYDHIERSERISYRIENLHFAVPIAV